MTPANDTHGPESARAFTAYWEKRLAAADTLPQRRDEAEIRRRFHVITCALVRTSEAIIGGGQDQ